MRTAVAAPVAMVTITRTRVPAAKPETGRSIGISKSAQISRSSVAVRARTSNRCSVGRHPTAIASEPTVNAAPISPRFAAGQNTSAA
jgi:hypothetical protein